jgi:hypothetical protein
MPKIAVLFIILFFLFLLMTKNQSCLFKNIFENRICVMHPFHRHIFPISNYFVCLLFLFYETLTGQNFIIRTFTTKDGLSHNDVRSVADDSSGFLWIATWDGLSRYNGYSFKNYYHKTDDSLSLPYFSIYNVMVDGGNNLGY